MCAGWDKYPNKCEWKLGQVWIMLQTPLLLVSDPLENMDNLYTWIGLVISEYWDQSETGQWKTF